VCVDYVVDFPAESYCNSGPAVGVTAAWQLSAGALVYAVYAVRRGLRVGRHRFRSKRAATGGWRRVFASVFGLVLSDWWSRILSRRELATRRLQNRAVAATPFG
jgi:hypothetical protein